MHILFAASEAAPYAKSGGLGDVIGSLPQALKHAGQDVSVILPLYSFMLDVEGAPNDRLRAQRAQFRDQMKLVAHFTVTVGWRHQECRLCMLTGAEGIPFYFVDNPYYFDRDQLYGYYDEAERYIFFSQCVLAAIPYMGCVDIIHCHDWQTAAIPLLLHYSYAAQPAYQAIHTVFTIHNLRFQGRFPASVVPDLLGLPAGLAQSEELEFYGDVNLMKAALYFADAITTVSPTYAREIRTLWYGEGLDGVLNRFSYKLTGIVNGLDMEAVNPARDVHLAHPFSDYDGKMANKLAFQHEYALPEGTDKLMIGFISRLDNQKGLDLIECVIRDVLRLDVQFVLLGTQAAAPGERKTHEDFFRQLENDYRSQVRSFILFDVALAQKIYAACDLFLMPSAFEPCGLSQMMAMRYGALPLVRETGGLKDTVEPYNQFTQEGDGFSFDHYNAHDMLHVIEWAYDIYHHDRPSWEAMARRAMAKDFGWQQPAQAYIEVYEGLKTL